VVGLFFISPDNFHFDTVPEYGNFSGAVLLLLYAFVGFEMAVVLGGETKDPQHSVPFALLVAVGAVAVLYILIQVVSIGTLPNLSASERPLAD
ncbi:amino acid permease, partial [Escherichia coli]|nr:amino acid permease [Escherichia coli]